LALTPWPHSQAEPSSADPEVSQLGESLVGGIQGQISLREAVADVADASYTVPWWNELGFSGVFMSLLQDLRILGVLSSRNVSAIFDIPMVKQTAKQNA